MTGASVAGVAATASGLHRGFHRGATRAASGRRDRADPEAAIAGKIPAVVVDRQARQFDRRVRPPPSMGQFKVTPLQVSRVAIASATRPIGIEPARGDDFAPLPFEAGDSVRADQMREFVGVEREAAFGFDLPHEAQRMPRQIRQRRFGVSAGSGSDGGCAAGSAVASAGDSANSSINANPADASSDGRGRFVSQVAGGSTAISATRPTSAPLRADPLQHHADDRRRDGFERGLASPASRHASPRPACRPGRAACLAQDLPRQDRPRRDCESRAAAARCRWRRRACRRARRRRSATRCLRPGAATVRPAASRGRPLGGRDQNAVAAVGEIEPRAAAGHERAERRAEAAQPLQPDRAGQRQPPRQSRHLAPVLIRRTEDLFGKRRGIGRAEQSGADRIGPQDPRAVDRPQPCGQRACRMHRQSRIADASQLEFRIVHRGDMTDWLMARRGAGYGGQTMTGLTNPLVSPAGQWQVHGRCRRPGLQSRDNLNPAEPSTRSVALR